MPTTTDPEVLGYLDRLRVAAAHLPADEFADAWASVTEHLDAAAERGEDPRAALARLGTPEEIVAGYGRPAAAPAPSQPVHVVVTPAPRPEMSIRLHEMAALILLPFGGLLAGVGWLVGVLLLWTSDRWTRGEKALGTLVVAIAVPVYLALRAWPGRAHGARRS